MTDTPAPTAERTVLLTDSGYEHNSVAGVLHAPRDFDLPAALAAFEAEFGYSPPPLTGVTIWTATKDTDDREAVAGKLVAAGLRSPDQKEYMTNTAYLTAFGWWVHLRHGHRFTPAPKVEEFG